LSMMPVRARISAKSSSTISNSCPKFASCACRSGRAWSSLA
jgi:hypothetical protein